MPCAKCRTSWSEARTTSEDPVVCAGEGGASGLGKERRAGQSGKRVTWRSDHWKGHQTILSALLEKSKALGSGGSMVAG